MNKFKENDKVYFIDIYGYIWSGTIDDIFHANSADEDYAHLKYVKNPYNGNTFGSCDIRLINIYPTLQAAEDANHEHSEKAKNEYRKQINSVNDLVKIMFKNPCGGSEDIDWGLREVVIEKAKELLNIDLEKDK